MKSSSTKSKPAMKTAGALLIAVLLAAAALSCSAAREVDASLKKSTKGGSGGSQGVPGSGSDLGGFFGPGGAGFGIPGFGGGNGWGNHGGGYGAGYGGPGGGYSRDGVNLPTVVCSERGPCYKKKLTCPAKCFTSYSRSGKNYGAGGGGGGCTMDCKKHCVAYC